ncbi:MAG: hypothetical protein AAF639_19610 [Chloroflexota bacterium]
MKIIEKIFGFIDRLLQMTCLTVLALVAVAVIGGVTFVLFFSLIDSAEWSADKLAIEPRYIKFCEAYKNRDYEEAFDYMTPDYQSQNTIESFRENNNIRFAFNVDEGCHLSRFSTIRQISQKKEHSTFEIWPGDTLMPDNVSDGGFELIKIDGEWYFTGNAWVNRD